MPASGAVIAGEFQPSATQRRVLRRNADLEINACKSWATEEQYQLLRRYLRARHPDGGMVEMDESDFSDMVEQSPVRTYIVEYREPAVDGRPGRLVGACLTDQQADGLSMIYSFFEPDDEHRAGLEPSYLDHIVRARGRAPYVYRGYGVEESRRRAHKSRFRRSSGSVLGWRGSIQNSASLPSADRSLARDQRCHRPGSWRRASSAPPRDSFRRSSDATDRGRGSRPGESGR